MPEATILRLLPEYISMNQRTPPSLSHFSYTTSHFLTTFFCPRSNLTL